MATDKRSLFVNGGNGGRLATPGDVVDQEVRARDLAPRCEFVDLRDFHIQHELFRKIPVDLMFHYNFVPLEETPEGWLVIAIADPSKLAMVDEIGLRLSRRIKTRVATLAQIEDILKKTE